MQTQTISSWLNMVKDNNIHAFNKVNTRELAICVNFLQIPDTSVVIMTTTIMKNKTKKNSLDPISFAKLMTMIESGLSDVAETTEKTDTPEEFFKNVKSLLDTKWYTTLCCHRVFFIPDKALFPVIQSLFSQVNIRQLKLCGIEEIAVYANTKNYDFHAKFY